MDDHWCKPRKIFHLDNLQIKTTESEQEYFAKKWADIEKTVVAFLLQGSKPPSIVLMNRALHSLLVQGHYNQIHQNLIKTFYRVYKQILGGAFLQSNSLISLLAYYIQKKHHYRILFDVLNNYIKQGSQRGQLTIEQKAYKILSKQIINSEFGDKFIQQFHTIVDQYREANDATEATSIQYQLQIISFLGIYQYFDLQFIEKAKVYFVNFSETMVKNEDLFLVIANSIKKQTMLNTILKPSENTVRFLQKQLIQQYYPFMIEYMDYLIQYNKLQNLKLLWSYSLRLNEEQRQLLCARFKQIIKDVTLFLKEGQELSKILQFIDKMKGIIAQCFDSNKTITNSLYITIEQTLLDHQKRYNEALGDKIFKDHHRESYQVIQKLFKLIPNKQKFIKEFEARFFKWIISENILNAKYQQGVIQMIRKECGSSLCKKLERMLIDVWRDGQMVYYTYQRSKFKCRLLGLNDWPKFRYQNILLPDALNLIITQFQHQFKKSPEHACKQLQWINDLGTITLAINQVQSIFSQKQAALIFVLSKSFRPMKLEQLSQVLRGDSLQIGENLKMLTEHGILQCNEMNQSYELNDSNKKGFVCVQSQQEKMEQVSVTEKRDNTAIIEAAVVRIMKKKKTLPKTDLTALVFEQLNNVRPSLEEVNHAVQRLANRDFVEIDKSKGILRYKE